MYTDPDVVELGKLLEMKGLKRGEQATFQDIFKDTKPQVSIKLYEAFKASGIGIC